MKHNINDNQLAVFSTRSNWSQLLSVHYIHQLGFPDSEKVPDWSALIPALNYLKFCHLEKALTNYTVLHRWMQV